MDYANQRGGRRENRPLSDHNQVGIAGGIARPHRESLASKLLADGLVIADLPHVEEAYIDVFIAKDADDDGGGTCEFDLGGASIALLEKLGLPVRFTVAIVCE